jgi:hypothetical protein
VVHSLTFVAAYTTFQSCKKTLLSPHAITKRNLRRVRSSLRESVLSLPKTIISLPFGRRNKGGKKDVSNKKKDQSLLRWQFEGSDTRQVIRGRAKKTPGEPRAAATRSMRIRRQLYRVVARNCNQIQRFK